MLIHNAMLLIDNRSKFDIVVVLVLVALLRFLRFLAQQLFTLLVALTIVCQVLPDFLGDQDVRDLPCSRCDALRRTVVMTR